MHSGLKYVKLSVVLAFSLILTVVANSGAIEKTNIKPVNTNKIVTQEKVIKSKNAKKESATEKATEKSTQKAKEKATEKATQKKTKATEKATQKATVKPTEVATEKATKKAKVNKATEPTLAPTEPPTEVITEESTCLVGSGTSAQNATQAPTAPTDAPTEWSQELQDLYDYQLSLGYVFAIDNPDYTYKTDPVVLSEEDRKLACQIVYGEAGGEGFVGCCLVAQCLKDSMVFLGHKSIKEVQKECRYDGWQENYSETAEQAVDFIFNQNKSAIAHRLLFFYATDMCTSEWHESQYHVLTRGNSRFFDMW